MSETETNSTKVSLENPICDPSKKRQTPHPINDKSDMAENIESARGSTNKNKSIISRPGSNELSRFSDSAKTKHKTNSHKLSVVKPQVQVIKRARSPVTVQEWIAALPDTDTDTTEDTEETERGLSLVRRQNTESSLADESDLVLGAEAGYSSGGQVAKLMLHRNNGPKRTLQHSDTAASFRSNISHLSSSSSVDSAVLQSRTADPEELLYNLGFGGCDQLARIPARFLRHKSVARGVTVESFVAKQEDVDTMVEYGFAGYRGLHGSPNRRPSEIVEKILSTLVQNDRELRRKNSSQSWATSACLFPGVGGIPSRFRLMDPRRKTFQSIVEEVRRPRKSPLTIDGQKRSFKDAAETVISGENEFNENDEISEDFSDDDAQVSDIEEIDSDWSDEERAELERMFGAMSARGQSAENIRRARKSIRRSRRRPDINGNLARLVFTRDNDEFSPAKSQGTDSDTGSVSLSCDTFCDSGSDVSLDRPHHAGLSLASESFCDSEDGEDTTVRRRQKMGCVKLPTLSVSCHLNVPDTAEEIR